LKKGADPDTEKCMLQSLDSLGLTGELVIQVDKESGAADVARRIAAKRKGKTIVRLVPKRSHKSNGGVERMHQFMQGMLRTDKDALEQHYAVNIKAESPIFAWMVRHEAWKINRFHVRSDGQTVYRAINGVNYTSTVVEFGETVEAKLQHDDVDRAKFAQRWTTGVWLGRSSISDEHIVGTSKGILLTRTVKRLEPDKKWQQPVLLAMKGTPWAMNGVDGQAAIAYPKTSGPVERAADMRTATMLLRMFWQDAGKTVGCRACHEGGTGIHHSVSCKRRQLEWRNKPSTATVQEAVQPHPEAGPSRVPAATQRQTRKWQHQLEQLRMRTRLKPRNPDQ
jgi:hypothetical protein